ncbi:MAG TPA: asparagine synthase C-terminal domain-containing protein, partial [Sedimentisphaerales bacterium]|nr:asparagine synthase C-terminal domain-containing protein [Sedimentisphaerales bacterium]
LASEFRDKLKGSLHTKGWLLQKAFQFPGQGVRNQMGWLDIHTYLLNDIIVKMERATMSTSVEARCPFLDHRVMELACAIPDDQKMEPGVGKLILKEAFQDMLPLAVLMRPKRGFGVPMNEWLRSEVGRQMLMEMMTDLSWPWEIFDPSGVTGLVEAHVKGDANIGHAVWLILVLHMWMKKHFG